MKPRQFSTSCSSTCQTRHCKLAAAQPRHLTITKKWRTAISPLKWRGCSAPRLAFDKLLSTSLLQYVPNKTRQTRRCSTSPLDNSKKWRTAFSPLKWRRCSAPRPAFDKLLATSLLQHVAFNIDTASSQLQPCSSTSLARRLSPPPNKTLQSQCNMKASRLRLAVALQKKQQLEQYSNDAQRTRTQGGGESEQRKRITAIEIASG
jgi:hypothetical protein